MNSVGYIAKTFVVSFYNDIMQLNCGDHFEMYNNTKSLHCQTGANIVLWINYTSKPTNQTHIKENQICVYQRWGLGEGERVHCFPASFPSPPEASCQKRSERRRTWCSKKGRDQGVSQDPLREQQMKQSKPVSPRFHWSDCRWASKTETGNHQIAFQH